jgi:hypothetical protein
MKPEGPVFLQSIVLRLTVASCQILCWNVADPHPAFSYLKSKTWKWAIDEDALQEKYEKKLGSPSSSILRMIGDYSFSWQPQTDEYYQQHSEDDWWLLIQLAATDGRILSAGIEGFVASWKSTAVPGRHVAYLQNRISGTRWQRHMRSIAETSLDFQWKWSVTSRNNSCENLVDCIVGIVNELSPAY